VSEPAAVPEPLVSAGWIWLRRQVPADALDNYRWRSDPEIARYDGGSPLTVPFSNFTLRFEHDLRYPTTERRAFAIETADAGHIGTIMYYGADYVEQVAEMGITIGPGAARERGAGSAATILFLRHTWATLPVRRMILHTLTWNERAQRAFRRAGFGDAAVIERQEQHFLRMEVRREWWLLWDMEGRFERFLAAPEAPGEVSQATGLAPA